jgi:hypothetical protein
MSDSLQKENNISECTEHTHSTRMSENYSESPPSRDSEENQEKNEEQKLDMKIDAEVEKDIEARRTCIRNVKFIELF